MKFEHHRIIAIACAALLGSTAPASDWLYGIHFYGDTASSDVEIMTGNKGIWSLEIVVTNSDIWWGAPWQRDNRFNTMAGRGHSLIVRIQPQWDFNVPKSPDYPLADFLPQAQQVAEDLKFICRRWQIGNEPNILYEWDNTVLSPADYVNAYRQIRTAIKSVVSPLGEQEVLLAAVSPGAPIGGVRHMDGNQYLAEMCALLDPNEVDGFTLHAYGNPSAGADTARDEFIRDLISQLAIIDYYGFSAKPVYVTEWNRATTPSSASSEAISAQFLHGALADIHAWNQRLRAHPIAAACWFVYEDNPSWEIYSIEGLRAVNPSGADNDLYDAFQFAATQNYPSAFPPPGGHQQQMVLETPPGTNIAVAATISSNSNESTAPLAIDGIIAERNYWLGRGGSILPWLMLDLGQAQPLSGMRIYHAESTGLDATRNMQAFLVESAPDPNGPWSVEQSFYNDQAQTTARFRWPIDRRCIRIFATDAGLVNNFPVVAEWELFSILRGDFDANAAVDACDVAMFQQHFGGSGVIRESAAAMPAHFDEDGDIDFDDFNGFEAALTGPAGS
jgi:hypothetical protein